jgi:AcrR family transcriptional regulator
MFRLARGFLVVNNAEKKGGGAILPGDTDRRVRADARRNIDTLLKTAKAVFATAGVNAPIREIAEKAGVGVGTIYRHFPHRSDLIAAVFSREIDACADAAATLVAEHEPGKALAQWMQRYAALVATKRGLATALHSGDPAFENLPAYFETRLVPVLQSLLEAERMVALLIDGLRYGTSSSANTRS